MEVRLGTGFDSTSKRAAMQHGSSAIGSSTWLRSRGLLAFDLSPATDRDVIQRADRFAIAPTTLLFTSGILLLGVVDLIAVKWSGLCFIGWATIAIPLALTAGIGVYGVFRRLDWVSDLGLFLGLWFAWGSLVAVLSYCMATADFPLVDGPLARVDTLAGLDWTATYRVISAHAFLRLPLAYAYATLSLQALGSVIYLALTERRARNEELFLSGAIAALITVLLSALIPAVGPHGNGTMPPWSQMLLALRAGARGPFSVRTLQGIVCVPSLHTVAAILFVCAHRPPSRSFWVVLTLNLVMLPAIPFAGHHYLTDVAGGAALAALAMMVANKVLTAFAAPSSVADGCYLALRRAA